MDMEKEKTFEEAYPKWVLEEARKRLKNLWDSYPRQFEKFRVSEWQAMGVICGLINEFCTPPLSQADELFLKIVRKRQNNPSLTLEKALHQLPMSGPPTLQILKEHFNEE